MAPYLLEKKLVLAAIGKKQVKIMLKTRANESHNFLLKYNLSDEYARKYIIVKNNIKHKICDMTIIGEDEIENIKKMSYTSILELLLLNIQSNNYMIEYLINDN